MQEYFILLNTKTCPDGILGNFLGKKNRSKEALLDNITSLFESYSKNSLLCGWIKEKQARIYLNISKERYPDAKLVKVIDVYAKATTMEII